MGYAQDILKHHMQECGRKAMQAMAAFREYELSLLAFAEMETDVGKADWAKKHSDAVYKAERELGMLLQTGSIGLRDRR
ncbi:MAG: hypothetical protein EHM35_01415 [Planctomycetaceae bacterium]|nr:MAG: hypothetical protein EHM35_01415 [Planctomycetaceae bacterium]